MWLHLSILVASLIGLIKSADYLVEYSARLARRLRVSDLVVGLIITSVGTSLPELASSFSATLAGSPGLVLGNVVGSNIANIGLVLGVAACVRSFPTSTGVYERDGAILLASAAVLFAVALDNRIGRIDAAVFLVSYVAYAAYAARTDREGIEARFRGFLDFVFDFEYAAPVARRLSRKKKPNADPVTREPIDRRGTLLEIGVLVASLVALIVSARFLIGEAVWLARLLDIPENLIGLSLIAVGTSLPELLVSVTGALKGKAELVLGNVMGSNIANTLLILGSTAMLRPLEVGELTVVYTIPIMLFFSLTLLHFVRSGWRIGRGEGAVAVLGYVAFLAAAFLQGWE